MAKVPKRKINPDALPSNNRDTPNIESAPKAVASGRTKKKKRSLSHEVRVIVNDLFFSVVVPSTKSMIYEFGKDMLGQMILGQNAPKNSRGLPVHQAYNRMYTGLASRTKPMTSFGQRAATPKVDPAYQDIYFDYEQDARLVLASMLDRLANYGKVTLGDMMFLCGLNATTTHQRYFWTDLSGSEIMLTSEGWLITLPEINYK